MRGFLYHFGLTLSTGIALAAANVARPLGYDAHQANLNSCKGYVVTSVREGRGYLRADLKLAAPCGVYKQKDVENLVLEVDYQDENRLHVVIQDAAKARYQVPESVFPRPDSNNVRKSNLEFKLQKKPFSFQVIRKKTGEKLFDTSSYPLIFKPQYLRIKTSLPKNPNLYGLGEHTDSFRLPTKNYTRTLWSRDSFGIPQNSNLYGNHPVYYEHRTTGTHGVFLLNSNGMDIKIDEHWREASLEYNVIGGILDFYFLEGPDPQQVSREYAKVAGLPAMVPYWGLGFHQCRYGYRDWIAVATVIEEYKKAGIPLETMWTDIDYMDRRRVFTNDPERFPIERLRQIVGNLHENDQKYIVMVDPAVAAVEGTIPYEKGAELDIFMKKGGEYYEGVVWPGVTVYPDWFHPNIIKYWDGEFERFFNPETGVDIDGVWIDMNEPANFCEYPCEDPAAEAERQNMPPEPPAVRPDPSPPLAGYPSIEIRKYRRNSESYAAPIAVRDAPLEELVPRQVEDDVDYLNPPYDIQNDAGELSSRTADVDIVHANGLVEYDVHNLYGSMMSERTRETMLKRRPGQRPLVITRSTFAGAGRYVGKWLGDNLSTWEQYRFSIGSMINFAAFFQMPMVGSDICGFGGNTSEKLCARWAGLGAFNPFFRNHNDINGIDQEFFRWPLTISAARNAMKLRYALLDYLYSAMHKQSEDGTPVLQPLWYLYPKDKKTYNREHEFFFGQSILVTPVLEENSTSVKPYFPKGLWYDIQTGEKLSSSGQTKHLKDIPFDKIPTWIKGGSVVAVRHTVDGHDTTTALRKRDLDILIAPDERGRASGEIYFDDGISLDQKGKQTFCEFRYENETLRVLCKGVKQPFRFANAKVFGGRNKKGKEGGKAVKLTVGESRAFHLFA